MSNPVNSPAPTPIPAMSYATEHQSDLPGNQPQALQEAPKINTAFDHSRDPSLAVQQADLQRTEAERRQISVTREQRRDSFMVSRTRPMPEFRPGPHMTYGPDRSAFNQRWDNERQAANQHVAEQQAQQSRDDRRAAFMKARQEQDQTHHRTHTQTQNKEGR